MRKNMEKINKIKIKVDWNMSVVVLIFVNINDINYLYSNLFMIFYNIIHKL
jgi:hypothetical protein